MASTPAKNSAKAQVSISSVFAEMGFDMGDVRKEFEEGAGPSFSVLSIRGSRFRVRRAGEETVVTNDEGDPRASLEVVIVRANENFSKAYYAKNYEEGDDAAPVCYSMNGVRPEPDAEDKQSKTCATCPKNARGSRITESGQKLKACADVRRVAIVPYPDIDNAEHGGPMLLRIPAASLRPLADYSQKLAKMNWPVFALVTKVTFDPETSYPRLMFKPVKPLSDDEARKIIELRDDDRVKAILQTMVETLGPKDDEEEGDDDFEALKGKTPPPASAPEEKKPPRKRTRKADEVPDQETPEQEREREDLAGANGKADDDDDDDNGALSPESTEAALDDLLGGLGM